MRLLWKENGAVTVFSVLVLSSLLLFFGMLIDYARIAVMHKQTESAVRSGVRSVLSAYDAGLYEEYGLFGRGGTDGSELFTEALQANVSIDSYSDVQMTRMASIRIEETMLYTAQTLGDHRVFARGVLEEMKYKAPIDFSLELIAKLAPMAVSIKEASSTIDVLEQMNKLYEQREEALEDVLRLQRLAAEAIERSGIKESIDALSEKDRKKVDSAASSLQEQIAQSATRHDNHLAEAGRKLVSAQAINTEMKRIMQESEQNLIDGGFDTVAKHAEHTASEIPAGSEAELNDIKQNAAQLIYSDEWFEQYEAEREEQQLCLERLRSVEHQLQASISNALSLLPAIEESYGQLLVAEQALLEQYYAEYEQRYLSVGGVLAAREKELQEGDVKSQLKKQKREIDTKWNQARSMLSGLSSLQADDEAKSQFEQVKLRYERNAQFNKLAADAMGETEAAGVGDKANTAVKESMTVMSGLYGGMADMLEKARDDLYYGEYALQRFQYFSPRHLKSMLQDGEQEELSSALSFTNQEAEYVLYGFHNPVSNIAAAYGELFAIRLSIRTMEGLLESKHLGHPLLIMSAAVIYGLQKTMEDMLAFADKGEAQLSKYVRVNLSYKDYLRLFMLLHGGGSEARLSRMIAVIEQNRNITLAEVPTAVTGEAKVSMKLWFIPGLARMLERTGLLDGKVVDGRYETVETIGTSY